jgi:DNA-binding Lrp family transcriptional regulator
MKNIGFIPERLDISGQERFYAKLLAAGRKEFEAVTEMLEMERKRVLKRREELKQKGAA